MKAAFPILILAAELALGGCEKETPAVGRASPPAPAAPGRPPGTAQDQSNAAADVEITAAIRRAIMADETMSSDAKNCKVITVAGAVTLRGPVATQEESRLVESRARGVPGVASVLNELEVRGR